jgi:hypothetical protein
MPLEKLPEQVKCRQRLQPSSCGDALIDINSASAAPSSPDHTFSRHHSISAILRVHSRLVLSSSDAQNSTPSIATRAAPFCQVESKEVIPILTQIWGTERPAASLRKTRYVAMSPDPDLALLALCSWFEWPTLLALRCGPCVEPDTNGAQHSLYALQQNM